MRKWCTKLCNFYLRVYTWDSQPIRNDMEKNKIPINWGRAKLVPIRKSPSKGKQNDPKFYQGLQVGSTLCKTLAIHIINHLKNWYEKERIEQNKALDPREAKQISNA